MITPTRFLLHILLTLLAIALANAPALAQPIEFAVTVPQHVLDQPFTGKVVVYLSRNNQNPRNGPNWFRPEPMYSADFRNVAPGEPMVLTTGNAVGFPGKMSEFEPGEWIVQVVVDRNLGGRAIGSSPGNIFSTPLRKTLDPAASGRIEITADQVVPERTFRETASTKFVRVKSKLLSDFYGRDTYLVAAVQLPPQYDQDEQRRFPVLYTVDGFGGTVYGRSGRDSRAGTVKDRMPLLIVHLDANCPTGHSVFADSDNNGPWGKALTTELIPEIDRTFRTIPDARARLLTGHSSGGWSSLWLQITYPEVFGGTWSTAPDPVDFRDFQQIDIYKPGANMFFADDGSPRPLARRQGSVAILYKDFVAMERPIRGEQIGSFEAVFSPRAKDGTVVPLFDRDTGAIDPQVAQAWKRFDIGLILRENWAALAPKLSGRIRVYMGDADTFYLEGAAKLLAQDLKALGADAVVEFFPGDHGSFLNRQLRARIDREMCQQILQHFPDARRDSDPELAPPSTLPATRPATRPN